MARLPAQEEGPRLDWPLSLLRNRVPDKTGLSLCSGGGSWAELASLLKKRDLDLARASIALLVAAFLGLYKRPCKIWAPYGGHCVEKSLAPKSKYVDTPKPGSINCLDRTNLMV